MRKTLALVVCAVLVSTPFALADESNSTTTPANLCPADSLAQARSIVHSAFAFKRYKQRPALEAGERSRLDALRACLTPSENKEVGDYLAKKHHLLGVYRAYRKVAPYRGFNEGDPWLEWLAVPAYIVACETNGYRGAGRWSAHNASSSAAGPYQIMLGRIYPARTPEQKLQNHRRAAEIWREQGPGAWVCA